MMFFAVIAFTLADVRSRECAVACRWAGYDGGVYAEVAGKEYCHCIDAKLYKRLVDEKRVVFPAPPPAEY